MTLERETIAAGAAPRCGDCGAMPALRVHRSGAGFYIGSWCRCGPCSRESGDYPTRADAGRVFQHGSYGRCARAAH
jgi:hypothetical protein